MVTTCSRSATRTTDCVLFSWAERNLGRYERARAGRACARARHYDSVLHSYYFMRVRGAGAFLCITYRGKLLQHKSIRVQCINKSTQVPVSPVPQYCTAVILKGFLWLLHVVDLQPVQQIAYC
jgi:hypothetical protein